MTQDAGINETTDSSADQVGPIEMFGQEVEATAQIMWKKWTKSKTLIVNVIALALLEAEHELHFLQPLLPVNVYAVIAFSLPPINVVLRFLTTQGIKL